LRPCKRGHTSGRDHNGECRECDRIACREWRAANPEKIAAAVKRWRKLNPDKVAAQNARRHLHRAVGCAVAKSLRAGKQGRKWESLVGYTCAELRDHLARQFTKGMSWANYGEWHVDHILPKAMFNFDSPDDPDFRVCWALPNLRPLWGSDNLEKRAHRQHLI
jgi:hypothetical protein